MNFEHDQGVEYISIFFHYLQYMSEWSNSFSLNPVIVLSFVHWERIYLHLEEIEIKSMV